MAYVSSSYAQEYRGRVQGLITDASNAVVTGATVTLTNTTTGVAATRQSNEIGRYLFDLIQPGTYRVSADLTGFVKVLQDNVRVQSYGDVTVDLTLKPGSSTETVTVTASASDVQFNTSKLELTINANLVDTLPQVYRNPFLLARLDPSVQADEDYSETQPYHTWGANRFSAGGGGYYGNNLQVDGSQVSVGVFTGFVPAPGTVQEVTIQQNPVDAEYGHGSGGSVNIVLKSGTNDWHGNAFYQGQYPWANAMEDRYYQTVNQNRNHMFGGSLGNPIIKNKLFNFVSYEQWKQVSPSSIVNTMPTDLEKAGDFSQSLNTEGGLRTIYDPWSTVTAADGAVSRTPFAGNVIPTSRMSKIAQMYMPGVWSANSSGIGYDHENNYSASAAVNYGYKNLTDRADWYINDKLRVFGRVSVMRTSITGSNPTGSDLYASSDSSERNGTNYSGDAVYTISPNTILDVHGEWHGHVDSSQFGGDISGEGGWSKYWSNNWYEGLFPEGEPVYTPRMTVHTDTWTSIANLGAPVGAWSSHPSGDGADIKLSHDRRSHYLKAGFQTIGTRMYSYTAGTSGFAFNSEMTSSTYVSPDISTSGDGWATFLLGALDSSSGYGWIGDNEFNIAAVNKVRNRFYAGYLNDDWKVSRRLTINLGLRYELEQAFGDPEGRLNRGVDVNGVLTELQNNPVTMPAAVARYYTGGWKTSNGGFVFTSGTGWNTGKGVLMPKAGFAFRVDDKTALRGAWGRYASPWTQVSTNTTGQGSTSLGGYGYTGYSATSYPEAPLSGVPRSTVDDPFNSSYPLTQARGNSLGAYESLGSSVTWTYPDRPKQMSDRFSLSLQRQLPWDTLLDVTYYTNWTHNTMYTSALNLNLVDPRLTYTYGAALNTAVDNPYYNYLTTSTFPGSSRYTQRVSIKSLMKPYPQYGDLSIEEYPGGEMVYNALQLKLQKSFSKGFSMLAGYSYHYARESRFYNDVAIYLRQYYWEELTDPRQRLSMAGTWEVPFGRKRWLLHDAPRALDAVVGGWNVTSVLTWRSGYLLGFGTLKVTGDPTKDIPNGYYFNPDVFSTQPAYTVRTNPKHYEGLNGPGMFNLDASLAKDFALNEKFKFEARLEAFNALNNFTPADPTTSYGGSTFGLSVGQKTNTFGRRLQMGLKIIF
jgi:hypothetical protein